MTLKLPMSSAYSLILILVLAAPAHVVAQTRRQTPARPQPARTSAPAPTFDTLLTAHSYKIYAEVRSVGQLIRSNSINEILEPIMKLASPPKEFRTLVKWLNTHADEVMTSRMLVAAWPKEGELPDAIVAIEFASPEEAGKFQQKLNEFLPKLLPAPTPESSPSPSPESSPQRDGAIVGVVADTGMKGSVVVVPETKPPAPPYHLQQAGSLILITPTPLKLAKLRPAGSKLLAEDVNFRVARNRFNSEPIFVFIDVAEIEKEEKEQQKKFEEQRKQTVAEMEKSREELEKAQAEMEKVMEEAELEMPPPVEEAPVEGNTALGMKQDPSNQMSKSDQFTFALMAVSVFSSMYATDESKWPDAIGLALSLEGESFDVRALLINAPGEKSSPLPFIPILTPGPALLPESPGILPADTEMLVTMSLDLGPVYTAISKPMPFMSLAQYDNQPNETDQPESLLAGLEKKLKINIKDDLLPLIGSEIVVSVPLTGFDFLQPPKSPVPAPSRSAPAPSPSPSPTPDKETQEPVKPTRAPAVLLSLKDREAMRVLLPKIVEAAAFKGAAAFATTERREDTELVSYANLLSYAFIGNFLVISTEPATTRHIVDSYLKHQTLASDPQFKNYTRWQPRMVQAQLYVSPALMESYRTWVQQPNQTIDDQLRQMLTRLTIVSQPVTYSLSNEGFGPLHELHLPKNLVLMFIASIAGSSRPVIEDRPSNSNPN